MNQMLQAVGLSKKTTFVFPLLLFLLLLVLYWKTFSYPYIQDDWVNLYHFSSTEERMDFFDYLGTFFIDSGETFYRPLGKLYFYFIAQIFGANPIGFRMVDLLIVFCTAIVAEQIAFRLLNNIALAWLSGAWFVFSSTVWMDTLMWMAGMYDLGGVFFFLLSILLFLKNKGWASASCYLVAILFKEGPILLPIILFLYVFMLEEKSSSGLKKVILCSKKILPHGIVLLIYSFLRFEALSTGVLPTGTKAYKIHVLGMHVFTNIFKYLVWTLEALTGFANLHENRLYAALILLIGLTLFIVLRKKVWRNSSDRNVLRSKFAENYPLILFLFSWGAICLIPVLFLPNHAYRYYLIYSYIAFILVVVLFLNLAFEIFLSRKTIGAIFGVSLVLIYLSNFISFNLFLGSGLRAPVLSGSNALVQRGDTVRLMLSYVQQELIKPPNNALFVFDGVEAGASLYRGIDSAAFRGKNFLRYVHRDPSIEVIDFHGRFYGDLKRKKSLIPERTVVLGLKGGKIHRYNLEDVYDRHSAFYMDQKF